MIFVFPILVSAAHHEAVASKSPDESLAELVAGNQRFVSDQAQHPRSDKERLKETSINGQHPFAAVLACSDSRVPVEILFDQGFGDLFVVRVAGNSSGDDEMGSLEYCADHLGSSLLLVLGHGKCGAVTAAAQHAHTESFLTDLVTRIDPAVQRVKNANTDKNIDDLIPDVIEANTWLAVETILLKSEILRKFVKDGNLKVVAAIYDIETGKVDFLGEHPKQDEFLKTSTSFQPVIKAVPTRVPNRVYYRGPDGRLYLRRR